MVGSPIEGLQLVFVGIFENEMMTSKWWEARLRDCNFYADSGQGITAMESKWWEARLRDCNLMHWQIALGHSVLSKWWEARLRDCNYC